MSLVRGVTARSSCSGEILKPSSRLVLTTTGTPPGKQDQVGVGQPVGSGDYHLVARVQKHLEHVVDGVLAAV